MGRRGGKPQLGGKNGEKPFLKKILFFRGIPPLPKKGGPTRPKLVPPAKKFFVFLKKGGPKTFPGKKNGRGDLIWGFSPWGRKKNFFFSNFSL
jgi:hypothetical protein